MKTYSNVDSGIEGYEFGDSWIRVKFKYGGIYEYRSPIVSVKHIEAMKHLSELQDGLNLYINTHRSEVYSNGVKVT